MYKYTKTQGLADTALKEQSFPFLNTFIHDNKDKYFMTKLKNILPKLYRYKRLNKITSITVYNQ